ERTATIQVIRVGRAVAVVVAGAVVLSLSLPVLLKSLPLLRTSRAVSVEVVGLVEPFWEGGAKMVLMAKMVRDS
ncbi:hypothetical protein, partial [uncultured Halorubrum sp.]|uniref:hypothetical protein n=1 Tax=uncultured Halorubrum sp. TaxID=399555 RepID=UPI0026337E86